MEPRDVTKERSVSPVIEFPGGRTAVAHPDDPVDPGRRQVDLCIVFDTTDSMSDKIDDLVRCMLALVADFGLLGFDWRATAVPFGDLTVPSGKIVKDEPFVGDVGALSRQLRAMPRFSGGNNLAESSAEAMGNACAKPFREQAIVVLVLVTDEPALGVEKSFQVVDQALTSLGPVCFTIATDTSYYRRWATDHGGEWRHILDATDPESARRLFQSILRRVVTAASTVHHLGSGSQEDEQ